MTWAACARSTSTTSRRHWVHHDCLSTFVVWKKTWFLAKNWENSKNFTPKIWVPAGRHHGMINFVEPNLREYERDIIKFSLWIIWDFSPKFHQKFHITAGWHHGSKGNLIPQIRIHGKVGGALYSEFERKIFRNLQFLLKIAWKIDNFTEKFEFPPGDTTVRGEVLFRRTEIAETKNSSFFHRVGICRTLISTGFVVTGAAAGIRIFSDNLAFKLKKNSLWALASAEFLVLFLNFRFAAIRSICRFVRGIRILMKQHTMTTGKWKKIGVFGSTELWVSSDVVVTGERNSTFLCLRKRIFLNWVTATSGNGQFLGTENSKFQRESPGCLSVESYSRRSENLKFLKSPWKPNSRRTRNFKFWSHHAHPTPVELETWLKTHS